MAKQTNGGGREIRTIITVHPLKGKPAFKKNLRCTRYDFSKWSQYLQTPTAVAVTKQQRGLNL